MGQPVAGETVLQRAIAAGRYSMVARLSRRGTGRRLRVSPGVRVRPDDDRVVTAGTIAGERRPLAGHGRARENPVAHQPAGRGSNEPSSGSRAGCRADGG